MPTGIDKQALYVDRGLGWLESDPQPVLNVAETITLPIKKGEVDKGKRWLMGWVV